MLITGGTGSFGKVFVDTVLRETEVKKLIVFSRDELKQHEMASRLKDDRLRFFIGDVRDVERIHRAFHGVDVVVHAAALKQVPACEYNPLEAVKTNVLGAANIINAAIDCGVKRVLALSTDKAVNPVNLYGATKLCAEKLFVQGNSYSGFDGTRFACARYGNVMGSRGSVIEVFTEQRQAGRITITDERMTRFWITLPQGVRFVIKCLGLMHGGEVFVPKIPSMNIMDLAQFIAPGCTVEFTGIRPGEKLHEVLVSADEARLGKEFDDMFVLQPAHPWWKTENWKGGKELPDGYRYASDTNREWLSVSQLRAFVAGSDV
ncbi:MAG: UDP-N-acetylglucosamine 4,6-dehydratase (inverting) [Deltaproteobacteria bacterium]|nr:UDP-N-acetylglucosamine 4,6-dehydratase (inverting) [Deltaproteobacteria bacterium]